MAMLRDVRLLLIISLAIVCLIALKLCSSSYETSTATTSAGQDNKIAATKADVSTEAKVEATENAESLTAEVQSVVEETVPVEVVEKVEEAAVVTPKETAAEIVQVAESESANESVESLKPTVAEEVSEIQQAVAETAETAETVSEAANAVSEDTSESAGAVTGVVVESAEIETVTAQTIVEPEPVETKAITLRDVATSGEFMPDFNTDIESVQDGLEQYSTKLNSARTMLERLMGGSE